MKLLPLKTMPPPSASEGAWNCFDQQSKVEVTHLIYTMPLLPGHLWSFTLVRVSFKIFLLGCQLSCHEKFMPYEEVTWSWLTVSESLLSLSLAILAQRPDRQVKDTLEGDSPTPVIPASSHLGLPRWGHGVGVGGRQRGAFPSSVLNEFLKRTSSAVL